MKDQVAEMKNAKYRKLNQKEKFKFKWAAQQYQSDWITMSWSCLSTTLRTTLEESRAAP